jgi:hypothetical protein
LPRENCARPNRPDRSRVSAGNSIFTKKLRLPESMGPYMRPIPVGAATTARLRRETSSGDGHPE